MYAPLGSLFQAQYFINQYRLASKIASKQSAWAATAIAWMPLNDWVHKFPPFFFFFLLRAFLTADCPVAMTVLLVSLQALGTMVAIYIPAAPGCA